MRYVENVMEVITNGITVANLKRSDIQNVSTYDFTQYKHKLGNRENGWQYDSSGDISYGSTHKYESNCYYPVMWEKDEEWSYEYKDGEGVGEDKEGLIWELENDNMKVDTAQKSCDNVELKQSSSIGHKYSNEEFKDEKYKDILFDKHYMTYWLSCRYTHLFVDHGEFGICTVEGSNGFITSEDIGGRSMIETWNQVWCQGSALRPIVSINLISSGYDLEKVEEAGLNLDQLLYKKF